MKVFEDKGLNVGWQAVYGPFVTCPIYCVGVKGGPTVLVSDLCLKCAGAVGVSDWYSKFTSGGDAFDGKHCTGAGDEGGVAVGRGSRKKNSSCSVITIGVELCWD